MDSSYPKQNAHRLACTNHRIRKRLKDRRIRLQSARLTNAKGVTYIELPGNLDMTSKLAVEFSTLARLSSSKILRAVMIWNATLTRLFCPPLRHFRTGVPAQKSRTLVRPKVSIKSAARQYSRCFVETRNC